MTKQSSTTSSSVGQRARSAGYVFAAGARGFASTTTAMPTAHADPLENIRGARAAAPALVARSRSGRAAAYLGAAALSVVGGLASSPLTQAAPPIPLSPPCSQWQFTGSMPISQGNGQRADIPWQGTRVGGAIANVFQGNEKVDVGDPEGGVNGNNIDFTVNWTRGPGHYTASINNSGEVVLGVTTDSQNHRADWHTDAKFTCAVTAAPPPAAPPPAAPANQPAPAPAPAAPVTNAIQLSFGPPHLGSITATISNSSALTAKCTYDSTPFNTHRDFTVNPNGSTNQTFNGFNTGTSYHVVVSCHDASGKQTQEIGHAETNVTF
ncbi:hypothetical protein [Mycobacterium sp. 1081908.1]|uniref:hypothetical protein n=1 Tax=Mycobacterium sp. 1081908.1 TaxID=1834066 RepID=UPI000AAB5379|nr:hypothetical protein [Mycobacterium sp. 1081908.1]